jgi:phage-related protein (TIGR01555 family)
LVALSQAISNMQAEDGQPRRLFRSPELPPGVVPGGATYALDNAGNYGWLNSQPGMCGLGFPGYSYLSELSQRSEYRSPVETLAQEMTREWIKFTGVEEEKLTELEDAFDEFGVREHFRRIAVQDGFFGRSQLFIHIKGQDSDIRRQLPLLVKEGAIAKGALLGFKTIEPIWTTPYAYNSIDPTRPDFYKPDYWYVLGKKTHASRLLTFISHELSDILKPAYNFGGMSMSQLIEAYVTRWLKTVDSVNRMISNYSTSGILTNLQSTLSGDNGTAEVFKRIQLFNLMRDNRGALVLDKESEEFFQFNAPLSGLSELQAQAQEHMAAPTHIPLVKLTGITPSGLNASSDGEIKVFYDYVASQQQSFFDDHLKTVCQLVQLHLWGTIDEDIGYEWVPLDSPTDKEESEMRKSDGDRDSAYVDRGILGPDEVRERLRNDPRSGYTFISAEAPAAPLEQEHDLGEEAAISAHERTEESAEAAHKRALEADKQKAKLTKPAKKD